MDYDPIDDLFAHINVLHEMLAVLYVDAYSKRRGDLLNARHQIVAKIQAAPIFVQDLPPEQSLSIQKRALHIAGNRLQDIQNRVDLKV